MAEAAVPADGNALESRLRAAAPLSAKAANRRYEVALTGGGADYRWSLNGDVYGSHKPLRVAPGERVEIELVNRTSMAQPMHLHGHSFQVVALNRQRFSGALRDTLQVPPGKQHDPRLRRRQSGQLGVPLPQPRPHASGHDDDGGVRRPRLISAESSGDWPPIAHAALSCMTSLTLPASCFRLNGLGRKWMPASWSSRLRKASSA